MQHARDEVYCSLVARRAVARAALHLGIADMTAEALDVLGDVLLEYISRIGRTISHSVEASGRSSAHVNVLDALRATELCTTNAVMHVHTPLRDESNDRNEIKDTTWKGLATFLFGPDWYMDASSREGGNTAESAGGGKVGPSAKARAGWNAPYPEEIPPFPVVQDPALIANPHSLDREKALEQLHSIVIEKPDADENDSEDKGVNAPATDTQEIPDSAFQVECWGTLTDENGTKRKKVSEAEEDTDEHPSKKLKTEYRSDMARIHENSTSEAKSALYLPSYYPPMPRAETNYRTVVVDAKPIESNQVSAKLDPFLVRSSLVQLDQEQRPQYWGTIQSGPVVKAGWTEKEQAGQVQPQIVPLGRASGSRVSRILEGSMETSS